MGKLVFPNLTNKAFAISVGAFYEIVMIFNVVYRYYFHKFVHPFGSETKVMLTLWYQWSVPIQGLTYEQGWGEYQIYEYEYLYYVWVRVRVLDYYMSTSQSTSTGWWVRVQVRVLVYDQHSI